MSKFDKLLRKIYALDKNIRFDELRKILSQKGKINDNYSTARAN